MEHENGQTIDVIGTSLGRCYLQFNTATGSRSFPRRYDRIFFGDKAAVFKTLAAAKVSGSTGNKKAVSGAGLAFNTLVDTENELEMGMEWTYIELIMISKS